MKTIKYECLNNYNKAIADKVIFERNTQEFEDTIRDVSVEISYNAMYIALHEKDDFDFEACSDEFFDEINSSESFSRTQYMLFEEAFRLLYFIHNQNSDKILKHINYVAKKMTETYNSDIITAHISNLLCQSRLDKKILYETSF